MLILSSPVKVNLGGINMTFVVDFDGTLTNECMGKIIEEKNIGPEDYDRLIKEVSTFTPKKGVEVLARYNLQPIIITGRAESLRSISETWLSNNKIPYKKLIMMSDGIYNGVFNFNKYADFKIEEHLKVNPRFSLDDSKSIITILKQYDIPTFLVEDDFEKAFTLAVNTIMRLK